MNKVELEAKNNQTITVLPTNVLLTEPITIPDDCIGIVFPKATLIDAGVTVHGTPVLAPGVYTSLPFRKQYPTSYRLTSMSGNTDFKNMDTPVSLGSVIIGKFA